MSMIEHSPNSQLVVESFYNQNNIRAWKLPIELSRSFSGTQKLHINGPEVQLNICWMCYATGCKTL